MEKEETMWEKQGGTLHNRQISIANEYFLSFLSRYANKTTLNTTTYPPEN